MNAPRDLGPDFRSWLRDVPPMPADLPGRTLDQTEHTRQHRRWLWFLPGPKPTAGADGRDVPSRLPPPTTTTRLGGISTMFSPAKFVTATAVAALTGALLLVGPFQTSQVDDPATPIDLSDLPPITLVSGQATGHDGTFSMGTVESHDWGYSVTDTLFAMTFELDDERLSGRSQVLSNAHRVPEAYSIGPASYSVYLENDGGWWVGSGQGYQEPPATAGDTLAAGWHIQLVLEGQGGYEGLTAIMALDQADEYSPFEVSGAVMPLDLAPVPGPAPTTFE